MLIQDVHKMKNRVTNNIWKTYNGFKHNGMFKQCTFVTTKIHIPDDALFDENGINIITFKCCNLEINIYMVIYEDILQVDDDDYDAYIYYKANVDDADEIIYDCYEIIPLITKYYNKCMTNMQIKEYANRLAYTVRMSCKAALKFKHINMTFWGEFGVNDDKDMNNLYSDGVCLMSIYLSNDCGVSIYIMADQKITNLSSDLFFDIVNYFSYKIITNEKTILVKSPFDVVFELISIMK